MIDKLFYDLVRVTLGNQKYLSRTPTDEEWQQLLFVAEKQAIDGITFEALNVLSRNGQKPPEEVMLDWFSYAEQIKEQNKIVNQRCKDITKLFAESGYRTCILKGQGNAMMYPNPMLRVSGDIDIWVFGDRDEITRFVKQRIPSSFEQYHHIDFDIFDDVPVEVHYTPGRLLSPKYNKRFQNWCDEQKELILKDYPNSSEVVFPSIAFNVVYQMAHIMIHFFIEGVGMRHFVDYYYVLKKSRVESLFESRESRVERRETKEYYKEKFEEFGMLKFASGVMWIEKELLGLEERYLIVEPSEKLGLILKKEMEEGGNFGHYDQRYTNARSKGLMARGAIDVYRLLKLSTYFPSESFWKVVNKIENQRWKLW